jgi:hypothetical protein
MKETALETYGVRITCGANGCRYSLPWRRHLDLKESGMAALLVGVIPCFTASFLPFAVLHFVKPGGQGLFFAVQAGFILFWCAFWWVSSLLFTLVFGAMAYSSFTKWGRGSISINRHRVYAIQLCGEKSRFARVALSAIKNFETLPDGDDRKNPATPARLLAMKSNDVSRLLWGYPIELVDALAADMNSRLQDLRR